MMKIVMDEGKPLCVVCDPGTDHEPGIDCVMLEAIWASCLIRFIKKAEMPLGHYLNCLKFFVWDRETILKEMGNY